MRAINPALMDHSVCPVAEPKPAGYLFTSSEHFVVFKKR